MKVYVVERGTYSDCYVAGVFSTKELAEANILLHNGDGSVSEFDVDEQAQDVNTVLYTAWIDLETGEVFDSQMHDWHAPASKKSTDPRVIDCRKMMPRDELFTGPFYGRLSAEVGSFAGSDHAIKLAVEFRQQHLRTIAPTTAPATQQQS